MINGKFVNRSKYEFIDISSEEYREYIWPNYELRIESPLYLATSNNGHRVFSADGIVYYIPNTWNALKWKAKEDQPDLVL